MTSASGNYQIPTRPAEYGAYSARNYCGTDSEQDWFIVEIKDDQWFRINALILSRLSKIR